MSQNQDYSDPQTGNVARNDIDQIRKNDRALASSHSGSNPPSDSFTGTPWWDTSQSPNVLKIKDENGNWIPILESDAVGRDIINNLLTQFTEMSNLWLQEHDLDGAHKSGISANISEWKDTSYTIVAVDTTDTFRVSGDKTPVLLPDGKKGRMLEIEQPNQTFQSPIKDATYDSSTDETTVTLHSDRTKDLNTSKSIDSLRYGVVGPSVQNGLPLILFDKLLTGDGTESDSSLRLGAYSLPFDDTPVDFTAANVQTAIEAIETTGAVDGYLEPGGLTISNNTTDSDHDIDVVGGQVAVHDFNDNWKIVNAPDETPAISIDSTGEGGRINSSTLDANAWYEESVIYDSTNDTVGYGVYKDADRPTSASDLPGDFDYIRAMGTPGKTWWVRTDGSKNLLEFAHNADGRMVWTANTLNNFSSLLNDTNPASTGSISISSQAPPTTINVLFNEAVLDANSNGTTNIDFNNNSFSTTTNGQAALEAEADERSSGQIDLKDVGSQQVHFAILDTNNITRIRLRKISSFKAVK